MSERVADFDKLERRLRLMGEIETRTALRIGSGGGGEFEAVDLPVLRDGEGFPLIPGSSLKGALRSTLEALVRAAENKDRGFSACEPLGKGACGYHESRQRQSVDPEKSCTLCRLLGSHVVASHVRFSDALIPKEHRGSRPPLGIRDGVSIDRDLGVAYGNQKYDFEVVAPGTRFALEVFVDNPKDWLLGLLVLGFEQIGDGFTALGGFTSRGLGRVAITWTGLREVTATELLAGKGARELDTAAREAAFESWRKALADRYEGRAV